MKKLLLIFSVASMLAICSGQFDAFGSGINNDELDGKWSKQFVRRQFDNAVLRYTPTDGGKTVTLKFSDLKDGTFDLSACGDVRVVVTTKMDRFFKVGEENKDKSVVLIMLRHEVEPRINPEHPFAGYMAGWDADRPMGMFIRCCNTTDAKSIFLKIASPSKTPFRVYWSCLRGRPAYDMWFEHNKD
jgi:hypothetical protein